MPNWCDNSAQFSHEDKSKIDLIETNLKSNKIQIFNTIYPNPSGEWDYDWSVNNWGTKWDASIHDWERQDDNTIWVSFDSAWSPPINLYEFMTREGYDVSAYYNEGGMAFCGKYEQGFDDCYEYDITDSDSIDQIPEDIVDYACIQDAREYWESEQEADRERAEYEATVTEWFDGDVKPIRVGNYEATDPKFPNWPFTEMATWDGKKWVNGDGKKIKVGKWRGLKEEFNGA
jgi:hypothetical protein